MCDCQEKPQNETWNENRDNISYCIWSLMFTMVNKYSEQPCTNQRKILKEFLYLVGRVYPCEGCANEFNWKLTIRSPRTDSRAALYEWLRWMQSEDCSAHETTRYETDVMYSPLNKEELGYCTWSLLHTMAAYYPEKPSENKQTDTYRFIKLLGVLYPCNMCARSFERLMNKHPPDICSQATLSVWLCWAHNEVNAKLGKPIFNVDYLNDRWRIEDERVK